MITNRQEETGLKGGEADQDKDRCPIRPPKKKKQLKK